MSADLGLDSLLRSLRHAGLRVGVSEVVRLQQVFAREPALAGETAGFESLLRAVLLKSEADRQLFDRVFALWLAAAEQEVRLRSEKPLERIDSVPVPGRRRRFPVWRFAAALLVLAIGLAVEKDTATLPQAGGASKLGNLRIPTSTQDQDPPTPPNPSSFDVQSLVRQAWVGTVWTGWPALGLGTLSLLVTAGAWRVLGRRRWVPEPVPAPQHRGPPRVFLSPPSAPGPQLLDLGEQEALVWGIGRFVSDEPTRRLDLAATVRATAKAAGLPQLQFHRARHYREVWLWLDEAADDPALLRLADEVEAVLAAHGLPVERASFRGLPFQLFTPGGQVFAPAEVDERREVARVAVLTDGRLLTRQYSAAGRRGRIDGLLRGFSHWPELAFVDFSEGDDGLAAIVGRHGLEVLAPHRLVSFLTGGAAAALRAGGSPSAAPASGGDAAWAAACALSPSPVAEATAFLLRRELGLAASPWALSALQAEAPGPPGRLQWQPLERARRINWLRESEAQAQEEGQVAPGSLLGRALDFWEEAYGKELERRDSKDSAVPWADTPAQQHLAMERELLRLWRKPYEAIRALYGLHRGALGEVIQAHLGVLAPAGRGGEGGIELPWSWDQRSAAERLMLQEMKLGGDLPPVKLRRPGRFWLGLAACLGLGCGALITAALSERVCRPWEYTENGMVFVRLCPGTLSTVTGDFTRGSRPTIHEVTLTAFSIGKYEVTNREYRQIYPDHSGADNLPAAGVSWAEAQRFCEQLGFRLPTDAEWRYAARAGTTTMWPFGDDGRQLDRYAWFDENSDDQAHTVGQKKANPWGLHDMHGNVWEWVSSEAVRGGSFADPPEFSGSAFRPRFWSKGWRESIGFRCGSSPRRQP